MHADLRVLDADAHVIEPADVFGADALESMDLPETTPRVPCGDFELLADQFEHGFDAASYLRAMDRQGIDAAVLYPSMGLFVPFQPHHDATASASACAAYNDWIASYCAQDQARLAGVGIVPLIDPRRAAQEARRACDLGLVGVMVRPNHLYGRNLGDGAFDELYAVLEATGMVLAVHEGLGVRGATIGSDRFDGFALRHALSHPMEQMAALASLFLQGALERHPGLGVAFLESGTGWLPYWLARLDDHCEWMRETECAGLTLLPSEYFARQCVISCDPEDKLAGWTVSRVGADHVIWASDFPHPDAVFPGAVAEFLEDGGVDAAALPTVLWDTPLRFYGLAERFGAAPVGEVSAVPPGLTERMSTSGHEQVVFVADAPSGLRAVIAVHSTALGPSLGGIRFWHYAAEADAVSDALRLSEAMSLKAALAGLHQGGGKAVVHWEDPTQPRSDALLRAMGRAIDELGGRYIAAEDVGATPWDMDVISGETPWVTGVDRAGGSGDPSPVTAIGVVHAMGAVLEELDGEATLRGRRVVVQGAGHVGRVLVQLLVAEGARVAVADLYPEPVRALVEAHGVEALPVDRVLDEPCDVLAPCALGGVVSVELVSRLQCRAICGAANNQLVDLAAGDALAARGIVYAPDFVANAGGIINIAEEFTGYDRERALAATARVGDTTRRVFEHARAEGVAPARAAEALARRRIAEEGGGRRWRPGDPAAWTNGEPLRTLRP